jgi:hypothetical protein
VPQVNRAVGTKSNNRASRPTHCPRKARSATPYAVLMVQPHPHSGATYRLIAREDGAFEIEVSIPNLSPTTVADFATQADAERWIEQHKASVNAGSPLQGSFRMPENRTR